MSILPLTFADKRVSLQIVLLSTHLSRKYVRSGYFDEALALSSKYRRHDKHIKIQIENKKDFKQALAYIEKLKFEEALQALQTYGKSLIREEPKLTTQLLKQLNPTPQQIEKEQLPESLISLFMNNPDELLDFLEHATQVSSGDWDE